MSIKHPKFEDDHFVLAYLTEEQSKILNDYIAAHSKELDALLQPLGISTADLPLPEWTRIVDESEELGTYSRVPYTDAERKADEEYWAEQMEQAIQPDLLDPNTPTDHLNDFIRDHSKDLEAAGIHKVDKIL